MKNQDCLYFVQFKSWKWVQLLICSENDVDDINDDDSKDCVDMGKENR